MKRNWFSLLLAVLCSSIFWTVSAFFAVGVVRQAGTSDWPSVQGEVVESHVASHRGSKGGHTYSPKVTYRYTAGDAQQTGDRITLGASFSDSGGGYARRVVAEFPAGKRVPVYVNPADPTQSVLYRGVTDREWQTLGLLMVFVSIPAVVWLIFLRGLISGGKGRVGTVRVLEPAPGISVVRSFIITPFIAGVIGWFVGLALSLVVVLGFMEDSRTGFLIGWPCAAVLSASLWLLRSRWIAAGRCDTVIDQPAGLVIPARGGRSAAQALPLASIADTVVKQDSSISTNKRRHWRVHLVIEGESKSRPLVDIQREQDANEFDAWLRGRLGLADR